jgi:competence protein ComEC
MRSLILGLVFVSVLLAGLVWRQWPDKSVEIVICDVGQGDAAVIKEGFSQMVVDTGSPDKAVLICLGNLLPFWDREIEVVVITHDHADHIGGLAAMLEHYQVKQIITTAETYEAVVRVVEQRSQVAVSGQGDIWRFGSITGEVMWPPKRWGGATEGLVVKDKNHYSLVWRMLFGNDSVWWGGDSDCKAEDAMINSGLVTDATYLKVGHHGSKTSSCEPFLAILQPRQAWISVGKDNRFDHPHPEVVERLRRIKAEISRTDENGDIFVKSDLISKEKERDTR